MKLLNVRLTEEDAAKVAELRRQGVEFSTLVREAVHARHLALRERLQPKDVRRVLAAIYEEHPLDESEERLSVDATDRVAARGIIRKKLRRKAGR